MNVYQYVRFRARQTLLMSAILTALPTFSFAQAQPAQRPPARPGKQSPERREVVPSPVASLRKPSLIPISLQDAIDRSLRQNLGLLLSSADIGAARGQRWEQLSALLPHATVSPYADRSKLNLQEVGLLFSPPNFSLPKTVGPYSYFDARLGVTQTVFDWKAIKATQAASQSLKSAEYTLARSTSWQTILARYGCFSMLPVTSRCGG